MNITNDDPELDHLDLSEEYKAIKFEWTPELVKIGTSRGAIHPSIGPIKLQGAFSDCVYRPGMALPDPADTLECLKWIGLSDKKVVEVNQRFHELYPHYQAPKCGYDEKHHQNGRNTITFPLLDKMVDVYIKGLDLCTEDFEYTHEGYIKRGIQQGLRPEFAIFCGLHEDDPRALSDPDLFKENWFNRDPDALIVDCIIPIWMELQMFMVLRLVHEEKAWMDLHGHWLVHEGERLDEAKAREDDTERQRLREEATRDSERIREERRQELARYDAEEDARLEKEQALEAEENS
ncbi:uncharacterized protein N7500_008430 [Penicillium coprophilum]|uniref:uncharacterized protein n=1 Tax=Penicillium coprophilum TaxID=36646 RepID=UPI002384AB04|nr:uncharacterized protein N7500_008430 [Penicillium coprophilum]KAJ5158779.1 hypothetical protein N7500_008430 [Penicillium coprophilum]